MDWTIDATGWTKQLDGSINGNYPTSLIPVAASAISMNLALSTAGRLGFFIDYSELSDSGTHTFYVCRTHGSTGAVSVDYATGGDTHTSVSGTMNWADGEMDTKLFTVDVSAGDLSTHQTTNGLGEHRIWALLSNPTGGGVLHFGTEHTRAYGVIDNNVLASDANAVFYDSAAVTNGTGTQASPYNSVYDAIANIGTKRYLYGKGTTTVDGTFTDSVQGSPISNVLPTPSTRTGETDRVYIRNWSGSTWSIQGSGTSCAGFFEDGGASYCTYKGLAFSGFDNTATSANGFAIFYAYSASAGINVEQCSGDNINGGGNTAMILPWGLDGCKIWRCTSNNIQRFGDSTNQNTSQALIYDGLNVSVQRCEALNSASIVYHKRIANAFDVGASVRFCVDSTPYGVLYGASGAAGDPHSYTIVQCNLFLPTGGNDTAIYHSTGTQGSNGSNNATKHWWCNNVFYQRGGGEQAAVHGRQMYDAAIFNNIMLDCRKVWADFSDSSATGTDIEFADFNCEFGTTLTSQRYEWKAVNYTTAAEINAANSAYAGNDINQNPLFTDTVGEDFTLQIGSPALTNGVGGTQQGLYIGDFYTIGAN